MLGAAGHTDDDASRAEIAGAASYRILDADIVNDYPIEQAMAGRAAARAAIPVGRHPRVVVSLVSLNLSRVYRKVGIHSRVELIRTLGPADADVSGPAPDPKK